MCEVKRMKAAALALLGAIALVQMATAQQILRLDGEEIRIQRDRFGVPHIFANSERALFYGNGYAVAQDRLWQMERYRRDGRGEMAEIDPKALARDRDVRKLGFTEAERQQRFESLTSKHQLQIRAYIEGVNAWMNEASTAGKLPEGYATESDQARSVSRHRFDCYQRPDVSALWIGRWR